MPSTRAATAVCCLLLAFTSYANLPHGRANHEGLTAVPAYAAERSLLAKPAGLAVRGVTLVEALSLLEFTSSVHVAFSPTSLPTGLRVNCGCEELSIAEALDRILSDTDFSYLELGNHIFVLRRPPPAATLRRAVANAGGSAHPAPPRSRPFQFTATEP
jgi:hypothetical protein